MVGIDIADTIVVRRSINKGTKIITETHKPLVWAGKKFKEHEMERLKNAGDYSIVTAKGTGKLRLGSLRVTQVPDPRGFSMSTRRGTGLVKL